MKPILLGDTLPDINGEYHNNNLKQIIKYRGEKNIVLIFFPTEIRNGCEDGDCCISNIVNSLNSNDSILFGITRSRKTRSFSGLSEDKTLLPILVEKDNTLKKLFGISTINLGNYTRIFSEVFNLDTGRIIVAIDKKGKVIYKSDVNQREKCLQDEGHRINLILRKSDIKGDASLQ